VLVESIVPVFLDEDDDERPAPSSRDIGGVAWDVWQGRPIAGACIELRAEGRETLRTESAQNGRFRFESVPDGAWTLHVSHFGFIRGQLAIETPHNGRMSYFRLDLIAVPLKIRRLYGAVLERSMGEDLWGRLSPREIEERMEALWPVDEERPDRAALRQAVLERLRDVDAETSMQDVLAAFTETVEESYFSGRTYGEDAFLFARELAIQLQHRRSAEEGGA
jgi:hypothetical protein